MDRVSCVWQKALDAYEDLRSSVLTGQGAAHRLGLALFCRQGMLAWMSAWSECTPVKEVSAKKISRSVAADVPVNVQGDMVLILVSMLLNSLGGK